MIGDRLITFKNKTAEILLESIYEDMAKAIAALEKSDSPALKERLDEIRGAVERESYWCEDCQLEYPKKGFEPSMHSEHEVVPITVIAGWRQKELTELCDSAATEKQEA